MNNQNYLSVKVTNVNVEVSWNKLIINAGTCIQNVSLVVPARKILKVCNILFGNAGSCKSQFCVLEARVGIVLRIQSLL